MAINPSIINYLPGMRTLKTGLAVGISLLICRQFSLDLSFYAVIAAVISMDKNIFLSFRVGQSRMLGTTIGALLGGVVILFLPADIWVSTIGVILLIYLLNRLNLNASITIAAVVFLAVMVGFGNNNPLQYGLLRLLDTLIGIIVAWLVNVLIFPYNNLPKIQKHLNNILQVMKDHFETGERNLQPLDAKLNQLDNELDIYLKQFSWRPKVLNQEQSQCLQKMLSEAYCELLILNRTKAAMINSTDSELTIIYCHHQNHFQTIFTRLMHQLPSINSASY